MMTSIQQGGQPPAALAKRPRLDGDAGPPAKRRRLHADALVHKLRSGSRYVSPSTARRPGPTAPPSAPGRRQSAAERAPTEVWAMILQQTSPSGLVAISSVSHRFNALAFDAMVLAAQKSGCETVPALRRYVRVGANLQGRHFSCWSLAARTGRLLAQEGTFIFQPEARHQASRDVAVYSRGGAPAEVWNARHAPPRRYEIPVQDLVHSATASRDGRRLSVCVALGGIDVWDFPPQQAAPPVGFSLPHPGAVQVEMTPDGRFAVSGAIDGTVRFWSLETFQHIELQHAPVSSVVVSADGLWVAAASSRDVRLWAPRFDGAFERGGRSLTHPAYVNRMKFSPDGQFLAARGNRIMNLWRCDADDDAALPLPKMEHPSSEELHVFSPDSRYFASANDACDAVLLVDLQNLDRAPRTLPYKRYITRVDFAPRGNRLMASQRYMPDGGLQIWDLDAPTFGEVLVNIKASMYKDPHFAAEGSQMVYVDVDRRYQGRTTVLDFDIAPQPYKR